MGKSNSKLDLEFDESNLMGCAKIMCEKHGVYTCKQLPLWVRRFGFPENGSFSVSKLQLLGEILAMYERNNGEKKIDWNAFRMWKSETERSIRRQEKGRKKRGDGTHHGASQGGSHAQQEVDLLPGSAAHPSQNQQPAADPYREVKAQLAAAEHAMHACPESAPPSHRQSVLGPAQSTLDSGRTCSQATQTIEIIEEPNPIEPEAVGTAWTPEDLRAIAKELPDLDPKGGAPFADVLSQIVHVYKLSLREIRILTLHSIKLEWAKVEEDWPDTDTRYDWTPGTGYRGHVERLCGRIQTTFPATSRWYVVQYCVQQPGEMVADYLVRLEKVYKENFEMTPSYDPESFTLDEALLKHYFLTGMDEQISSRIRKHCIGLDDQRLAVVRSHAVHHERDVRRSEKKKEQARARLTDRFMKAQIRALQGAGRAALNAGLDWDNGCWTCGAPDHWARDCAGPKRGSQLCLTYMGEVKGGGGDSRVW